MAMRIWRLVLMLAALCACASASAQDFGDAIASIRESVAEEIGPQALGSSYAAMISFAVSPEISTARFSPENTEGVSDSALETTRIPLRYTFELSGGSAWRPFAQLLLAHEDFYADFELLPGEGIESDWETYGLTLTGGAERSLTEKLSLLVAASLGVGQLENTASYSGPLGQSVLRPAFEGLLFDWEAKARVYGASLAAVYNSSGQHFALEASSSLSHHQIHSFDESSDLIAFTGDLTIWDAEVTSIHPTPFEISEIPLAAVLIGGATVFLGDNRDALGFASFFEAGLGVEADLKGKAWRVGSLRLGLKALYGEDIRGWAFVLEPRF